MWVFMSKPLLLSLPIILLIVAFMAILVDYLLQMLMLFFFFFLFVLLIKSLTGFTKMLEQTTSTYFIRDHIVILFIAPTQLLSTLWCHTYQVSSKNLGHIIRIPPIDINMTWKKFTSTNVKCVFGKLHWK